MTERGDGRSPERVGKVLGELLEELGLRKELEGQAVLEEWDELVGVRISSVARPRGLHRGVLFVEVRSSAWLNELNLMKPQILDGLRRGSAADPVKKVVFTLQEKGGDG